MGHIFHVGADGGLVKRKGSCSFKTINVLLGGRMIIINLCEDDHDDDDDGDDDHDDDDGSEFDAQRVLCHSWKPNLPQPGL